MEDKIAKKEKLKEELAEPEAVVDTAEESSAVIDSLWRNQSPAPRSPQIEPKRKQTQQGFVVLQREPLEIVADTKYESVNNLKRRMTTRKRTTDGETSPKSEQFMLRAQAMLHQLRNKEE